MRVLIYSRPGKTPNATALTLRCRAQFLANLARGSAVVRLTPAIAIDPGDQVKTVKGELWLRWPGVGPVTAKILRGRNIAAPAAPPCNPFVLTAAPRIHQKHVFATPAAVRLIAKSTARVKARRQQPQASRSIWARFRNWHWTENASSLQRSSLTSLAQPYWSKISIPKKL